MTWMKIIKSIINNKRTKINRKENKKLQSF